MKLSLLIPGSIFLIAGFPEAGRARFTDQLSAEACRLFEKKETDFVNGVKARMRNEEALLKRENYCPQAFEPGGLEGGTEWLLGCLDFAYESQPKKREDYEDWRKKYEREVKQQAANCRRHGVGELPPPFKDIPEPTTGQPVPPNWRRQRR